MKCLKLLFMLFVALFSLQTNAFVLIDIQRDIAVEQYTSVQAHMTDHGFNPLTDRVTRIDLFLYFRELNDDSLTDRAGDETAEFVGFSKVLFGERFNYDADVDTGLTSFHAWFPPESENTCLWLDEFDQCVYDPVKTGVMGIGLQTTPDTLWLDEVRWEVEVLRREVDEPASLLLFATALCALVWVRQKNSNGGILQ